MTFKPSIWYPIALGLSVLNLVGLGAAIQPGETLHAAVHAALALAFGVWARRLRLQRRAGGSEPQETAGGDLQDRLDALEGEASRLRQELGEAQERLDFAERMLAQNREGPRVGPQR